MASGDDDPEAGHVRRRSTSSREHHDDEYVSESGRPASSSFSPIVGSLESGQQESATATTSGSDSQARNTGAKEQEHVPRGVRFSEDVQRDNVPRRSSSHGVPSSGGVRALGSQETQRPTLPPLSVNVRQNAAQSRPASGGPLSPASRSRGYSLRRALFQRNIVDGTSPIELQPTASSSSSHTHNRSESSSKKSGDATVRISPIQQEFEEMSSDDKKPGGALISLPNYQNWLQYGRRKPYLSRIKDGCEKCRKFILRVKEVPPSKDGRHIPLDASRSASLIDERTQQEYISNYIRSTRYSLWDFFPRQFVAQFRKLANFYFLGVSILQMIPGLSTTGTYTTIAPLLFFVALSMAKEGYDDYRRYKLDKAENSREASVLQPEAEESTGRLRWKSVRWDNLRVGDIIKLDRDEAVPADLVLLYSSGENNVAYVETMALDGETNLKTKQTPAPIAPECITEEQVLTCRATIVAEDPNLDLYKFEGRVMVGNTTSPLTNNEVIYRNSVLRNTPSVIGMIVYSGEECKIRMNANKNPRIKAPRLQNLVNRIVIIMVIFVVALSLFNTIAYQIWRRKERKAFYLRSASVPFHQVFIAFIIMFNTLIPLSLYVSMEIIKLIQMLLMNADLDMYDEKTDTPFKAQTSTINEELGQISYVFSDKTGTLTDNEMRFRKLSVAGTAWLHDVDLRKKEKEVVADRKKNRKDKGKKKSKSIVYGRRTSTALEHGANNVAKANNTIGENTDTSPSKWPSSARPTNNQRNLNTRDLIEYVQLRPHTSFAQKVRMLLLSIALCHTCLPETQEDGSIDFQAASPDELALVRAAQELGYLIIDRNLGTITLRTSTAAGDQIDEVFEVLDVIEFTSKRKRMSVVVRFPENKVCVITKGADSIIMQRLKLAALASKKAVEIEARANRRKSMEASLAIARKSSVQIEQRSGSFARPSISMGRPSLQRRSSSFQPGNEDLAQWLHEREHDVDLSTTPERYYSPRPSTQLNRMSMATSEPRSSMQWGENDEDLVEESMVNDETQVIERCFQHINDFATEGLRTLLYGYRFMSDDEYQGWKKVYLDASTSLNDRELKIEQAGELIELDLDLAGATAIEDKLQAGVPEAIDKLRRANIKMWMLTGDKRETAINIGYSCRLIKDYSTVTIVDREVGDVDRIVGAALVNLSNDSTIAHSVVVIDGQTLNMIEESKPLEELFFQLAIVADSVICCRASPSQKAKLVKGIRSRVTKSITLAIGDGANDIAMIQTAHVGIGITGKEGLQAARTSDYAIAQFRFLTKLLLVHGRWNYIRTCKYIVGTFWKEMLFYLTQALYQRWNGYTGTSLYESWSLSMFNTLFTSLPVIFMGAFEKDISANTLLAVPELYTKGQRDGGFNFIIFLGWMFMASASAMIVYFCMHSLYASAIFLEDGTLISMGQLTYTACVILIALKMQMIEMHYKSVLVVISIGLSVGGWFLWNIILSAIYARDNKIYYVRDGFLERFGRSGLWWLTLILTVACVVVFEYAVASLRASWFTTDADAFQALEKDPDAKARFATAAAVGVPGNTNTNSQQSSSTSTQKNSLDANRDLEDREREQATREAEVQEMLRNRPGADSTTPHADMVATQKQENKQRKEKDTQRVLDEVGRTSSDVSEMLRMRYGNVRE